MCNDETARLRKLADDRLATLNAIAQIGAEPPDAVLAIIQDGEPETPDGPGTIYHHSVADFRHELVKASEAWRKSREGWFHQIYAKPGASIGSAPAAQRDAYAGSMMAGNYAYTLAAILGYAEREMGPEIARRLADVADNILENGDDDDLNADVRDGVTLPAPGRFEQEQAGQLALTDPGEIAA